MAAGQTQTTAVPEELAKFAAMAEEWWDPAGKFKPLHRLNPLRLAFARQHLLAHFDRDPLAAQPFRRLSLVDVGCGGGLISEPLARMGFSVTALDAEATNINIARAHAADQGVDVDYRVAMPEDLRSAGETFDVVVSMEVVEHVADVPTFLMELAALAKPGGIVLMATLNRTMKSLALAKIGAEYILRWVPAGTHDWRKFVKPSELARGLRAAGLTVTDLTGMAFDPLTDTWSLAPRDLAVNYAMVATKPASA